jgi:hypothetical protein
MPTTTKQIPCQICNRLFWPKEMVITDIEDKIIITCPQCYGYINTCATCEYGKKCNFQEDHSEPQVVNRTIRQGFATVMTQMKNPNLIEKHCLNCRCGNYETADKGMCLREDNKGINCSHYKIMF